MDNKAPVTLEEITRQPFTAGVVALGLALTLAIVFLAVTVLAGIPFIGPLITLYGYAVLAMCFYRAYQFVAKKIKAESAREKIIRDAQNPLL